MNPLPYSGLKVVALEQAVSAPFCSRQLADLGADVIKVERPDGGDFARAYDSAVNGLSAYFVWLNRGKRSIALDLKSERGHTICARLLDGADVFLHNLAPGAVERMGFGYEDLADRNPRLIWCGLSGYGPDGPYRDKKAYDMLVQSESGVVSLTGTQDEPAKVGVSIADISSGLYAYSSIQAALYARERFGRGERIDISMFECLTEWMMPPLYVWMGTGEMLPRNGLRHNMIAPYGAYPCADGAVIFGIQSDREFERFCPGVLRMPEIASDPKFARAADRVRNSKELDGIIEAAFAGAARAEIMERLERAGIPNAAMNDTAAVERHAQLSARGRWREVETEAGTARALLPPHNLKGAPPVMGRVPKLGEHTEEILAELGWAD